MTSEPYVLCDPRLEGWKQTTELFVPTGAEVQIIAVAEQTTGNVFDKRESLWVRIEVDGEDCGIVFFVREGGSKPVLDCLAGINDWLKSQHEDAELNWDPLRIDPDIPLRFEYQNMDAIAGLAGGMNIALDTLRNSHPDIAAQVAGLFDNAIYLGRIIRESELKFEHERSSEIGTTVRVKQRNRSASAASKRTQNARAWQEACAAWVLSDYIEKRTDRAKPTNAAIATFITDNWDRRPFAGGLSKCPSFEHLEKRLIPSWRVQ